MDRVAIIAAKRTPIGELNGALSPLQGHELGAQVIAAALVQAGLQGSDIDETILGQVLTAGAGMNPARQAARAAGIHDVAPAMSINHLCGSGLRSVMLAAQQIETGYGQTLVAGGQESMSNAPHVVSVRQGKKLGNLTLLDSVMHDGLTDAFFGYPMGNTAENIADMYNLDRETQDGFALNSQQKASAAAKAGRFKQEITPVKINTRKGEISVTEDEYIRHDASAASMQKLRPAFAKEGTVTAANSSGINDGAAALILMAESERIAKKIAPLAYIKSFAHTGLDPAVMGLGPISASRKALERAGWSIDDVDLWEINEAFAAQSLAVIEDLAVDPDRVNVNGGAIALGHPIGASGARVLVTLIYEMIRREAKRGVATLCIGGGMGIALCVERD